MRNPEELSREELENVLVRIQKALYGTDYTNEKGRPRTAFDRNKVWDSETIELVDEAMVEVGLSPENSPED